MRKIIFIFISFLFIACNQLITKPENLISKDKMSEILVDLALNEQSSMVNPKSNIEIGTRHVFKKHHIKTKDFMDSYKYYTLNKDLANILENAQEQLINQYPELQKKLDQNNKEETLLEDDLSKGNLQKNSTIKTKEAKEIQEIQEIQQQLVLPENLKNELENSK